MIIGIGIDIVQIPRIKKLMIKYKNNFAKKILSTEEVNFYNTKSQSQKVSYLAKIFSVKEAISKAFGCGISKNLKFKDIQIFNDNLGKPKVLIKRSISKNKKIDISISDDYPLTITMAVISQTI